MVQNGEGGPDQTRSHHTYRHTSSGNSKANSESSHNVDKATDDIGDGHDTGPDADSASQSDEPYDPNDPLVLVPNVSATRNARYSSKPLKDEPSTEQEALERQHQLQGPLMETLRSPRDWIRQTFIHERRPREVQSVLAKLNIELDWQLQFRHKSNSCLIFRGRDKEESCKYYLYRRAFY